VDLSRRSFLGAFASAPLSRALGARVPGPPRPAPASRTTCVLAESRAGFARALAGRRAPGVVVFPGAAGWDASIASHVRSGKLVIFESAAGFADLMALEAQRDGLRAEFGLTVEHPAKPGKEVPPSYVDLAWPVPVRVRDFSYAVPVRGGEVVGSLGGLPVAAMRRTGRGALLFLGSPVGPALWSGDPEAHAWLSSVLAAAGDPS
jgi:hypothetical protein